MQISGRRHYIGERDVSLSVVQMCAWADTATRVPTGCRPGRYYDRRLSTAIGITAMDITQSERGVEGVGWR